MRPLPSVLIALALVASAVALGVVAVAPREGPTPAAPAPRMSEPGAVAPAPPGAPARPSGLSLADAIKELDLIRPVRTKLAEDFTVPAPAGGTFRLSEQRGKVIMVNFWATWCPPCLEEMPAMERLYRRHRDAGFTLIAVSVDTDAKKVAPFLHAHRLTFPVGLDTGMDLANAYAVRALPSSFMVARDGTLAALAIGPRHWDSAAAHALVEGMVR